MVSGSLSLKMGTHGELFTTMKEIKPNCGQYITIQLALGILKLFTKMT